MIGDITDTYARLRRLLPPWFGPEDESPVVNALLHGAAWVLSHLYSLYAFAKLQTRIATSTGGFLELAAYDHYGADLPRFSGESDEKYSRRIRLEFFRDRNTRNAIDRAVYDLTGQHPDIYEAWRPGDCGGYGTGALAYGVAGRYGSRNAPFEVIVSMPEPQNYGIPSRPGYGAPLAAYGVPTWAYADDADLVGSGPKLSDIFAGLERVRTAGITYYVRLTQVGDPNP